MKRVIGIIVPGDIEFDDTSINKGIGGSETWAIQISQEFARDKDTHVIVFCACSHWHFDPFGVEWVPLGLFDDRIGYQHFDHIILSRHYTGYVHKIWHSDCCDNVVIQAHDWSVGPFWQLTDTTWKYSYYEEDEELQCGIVKRIIALSDWNKYSIIKESHIPANIITIIPNGIDPTLFDGIDHSNLDRDNHILWSSRPERGCDLLVDQIASEVKSIIPDFEVDIASYDPIQDRFLNRPGINILGSLDKQSLYKEMAKHRVWFYPSIYPETFNITSIEAVMCGCELVLPMMHGMETTFRYFKNFGMVNKFDSFFHKGDTEKAIDEAVRKISDLMINYHDPYRRLYRESLKNYILENYTWRKVVEMYNLMWKEIEWNKL